MRDEAAESKILDFYEGPCGTAQWHGVLGNPVAFIACDLDRAVSDLADGRFMRIGESDQAEFFMRRGVIGLEMTMSETFHSARARSVECLFSEHHAADLGASPEGLYHVTLYEFNRNVVKLQCRPAHDFEEFCAMGREMFCVGD